MLTDHDKKLRWAAALALTVGLAAALRLFLGRSGFNEDELFQVTLINEGLPHFFVAIARLDQHPFFHFLQLKLWSVFSVGDTWLLLNSLTWHVVTCFVIFQVGRSWRGVTAGILAVGLYALVPQVIGQSVTLRMYAMIPALALGVWWLNVRALEAEPSGRWRWGAVLFLQVALGYSHAIGFYFVAWITLAAAMHVYFVGTGNRAAWRRWIATQVAATVLLAPLLVSALVRISMPGQVETGGNNDPGNVLEHWGGMVAGWGYEWRPGLAAGASFYALAALLGLMQKPFRALSMFVLLGPYLFAALMALLLAPMYKTPVYSAMLIPFACLILAGSLVSLSRLTTMKEVLVGGLLVCMAVSVFPATEHHLRFMSPYRPAALAILGRAQPGDMVLATKPYIFWGVLRYAVDREWGAPLEILPPLSGSWRRLIDKLGPDWAARLKLVPRAHHIEGKGLLWVNGADGVPPSTVARRVWVVQRRSSPVDVRLPGFGVPELVARFGEKGEALDLYLYYRADATVAQSPPGEMR